MVSERVDEQSRSERGAGLVEYALLIALISLTALAAVQVFGGTLDDLLTRGGSSLVEAGS